MTTQTADGVVGTTLGPFKITKVIGRGGMGTVYLGEHAVIGSRVAIKVLQDKLAADEGLVARFYAEARAVNLIGHENIVNIFDMNVVPPHRYYLVMEYLEGKPLNYILTQPVPANIAVPILVQVCDALQAAHDAGIVHRDLKPENIFLIKRGRAENFVKVLDFGLAKLLDSERSTTNTAAGLIVGTPEFMSPEQANSAPVDGRSDIYSLGCIAWLLATGRLPFPQRGLTDLLVAHRGQTPKAPHEVVPSVPRALSAVIMKSMSKPPGDRYQSANEFAAALEAALHDPSSAVQVIATPVHEPKVAPAPSPPAPGSSGPRPQQRHTARFDAVVARLDGTKLGTLQCNDISKGGMFLNTTTELPAVFSKVKITIPRRGRAPRARRSSQGVGDAAGLRRAVPRRDRRPSGRHQPPRAGAAGAAAHDAVGRQQPEHRVAAGEVPRPDERRSLHRARPAADGGHDGDPGALQRRGSAADRAEEEDPEE